MRNMTLLLALAWTASCEVAGPEDRADFGVSDIVAEVAEPSGPIVVEPIYTSTMEGCAEP